MRIMRHEIAHEVPCAFPARFTIDQNFGDVLAEKVANGALDQIGFLVNQERRDGGKRAVPDMIP